METTAATAPTPTAAASAGAAEQKARLDASTDYETFLTLLTAQIRNQDPLEPVDSTQFVAQLASFSTVEQQIQSNAKLDAILAALNGGAADLAGWIGKEVRAAAAAAFDGSPVDVYARPVDGADAARLVVRDSDGAIVASAAVDPQAEVVSWTGASELGAAEPGLYSFSVESFREGQFLEARDGEVFAPVTEVRIENDAVVLVLADGEKVNADAIEAVRAAAAA